jgi:hypothetical protein
MTLTLRTDKGSALTYQELDDNFLHILGAAKAAKGGGLDEIFFENDQIVTTDYTITAGKNAMTAGPITIAANTNVTIPDGSVWTIV